MKNDLVVYDVLDIPRTYLEIEVSSSGKMWKKFELNGRFMVLRPDMKIKEAVALCRLQHENVLQLVDVMRKDGSFHGCLMEYFPSQTLEKGKLVTFKLVNILYGEDQENISFGKLLRLTVEVSSAIFFIHEKKLSHRNIHPNSILCAGERIKICDLFLSKSDAHPPDGYRPEEVGSFGSSSRFFSQWQAVDMYSFAVTFFECILREKPASFTRQIWRKKVRVVVNDLHHNDILCHTFNRCLDINAASRPRIEKIVQVLRTSDELSVEIKNELKSMRKSSCALEYSVDNSPTHKKWIQQVQ
uniref:Protein kinase domain-containing protein n=1 Tax=Heterorhabditis bacteriophora TaxID=37862 RepID=A0A1I7XK44_HETBA